MAGRAWPVSSCQPPGTLPVVDDDWVTYAEAAEILGCHISTVSKHVVAGTLQNRRQATGRRVRTGALRRDDVAQLAETRQAEVLERDQRRRELAMARALAGPTGPPDSDQVWLSPKQAAEQLGLGKYAILRRIRRERLPATWHGGRWWIQPAHLWSIEAPREATATRAM